MILQDPEYRAIQRHRIEQILTFDAGFDGFRGIKRLAQPARVARTLLSADLDLACVARAPSPAKWSHHPSPWVVPNVSRAKTAPAGATDNCPGRKSWLQAGKRFTPRMGDCIGFDSIVNLLYADMA
jgi:hypothetical protein